MRRREFITFLGGAASLWRASSFPASAATFDFSFTNDATPVTGNGGGTVMGVLTLNAANNAALSA